MQFSEINQGVIPKSALSVMFVFCLGLPGSIQVPLAVLQLRMDVEPWANTEARFITKWI